MDLIDDDIDENFNDIIDGILVPRTTRTIPNIDDLKDAIVNDELILAEGDKIVIEKWCCTPQNRHWMNTATYIIVKLWENGDMSLIDISKKCAAMANWKTASERGWRFKSTKKIRRRRRET